MVRVPQKVVLLVVSSLMLSTVPLCAAAIPPREFHAEIDKVEQAVQDLIDTFAEQYPDGTDYLTRLQQLRHVAKRPTPRHGQALERLKRDALLANPLLCSGRLLLVKRKPKDLEEQGVFTEYDERVGYSNGLGRDIAMPSNHECNASLERDGYDNEIAILSPIGPHGRLTTLYRPPAGGYVGELDLHWESDRLLFTQSHADNWRVWEMGVDGAGLRQVSQLPADVDAMDACYLPGGKILFGSTASYQSVPCWHGQKRVSNLYLMDDDGGNVRQVCFDQDHDFHPCVLPSGQVIYHRWDYTGITHIFVRPLMVMNPDGTGQRSVYGSNTWFPNSLYFPRPIPGRTNQLVAILSGYHGSHRMGQLVTLDLASGKQDEAALSGRISGRGDPVRPLIKDALVERDWPKFLHPYPLSDKHFLVSCWLSHRSSWAIYLADVFDNLVLVREEPGYALLEPTPMQRRPIPPVIPDRVDLNRQDASVYLHDVYTGPGLAGVPRGTIKQLRVLAYHFGYRGLAGSDKIGYGGPWEAMRILGTVPLEQDGSAHFRIPANTPVAFQALDGEGKAVQLMRTWMTAMPGEKVSCIGCHETPREGAATRLALSALRESRELVPWYGPPRGFDFAREVQPVLDRHCVACHDGSDPEVLDLRCEQLNSNDKPLPIGYADRLSPDMLQATGGKLPYTPAYLELVHYIRRPGIEDDASLLTPGEYHADTSPLIQLLQKGHHGVQLGAEDWDRLITWIDLNGPCHGTWGDVFPIPEAAHQRRMQLRAQFGGPPQNPELIWDAAVAGEPVSAQPVDAHSPRTGLDGWSLEPSEAREQLRSLGQYRMAISLGNGVTMQLAKVPGGSFVMGDADGALNEQPKSVVEIEHAFWIGVCEVTNEQLRQFDPHHDSGYYVKRHVRQDDQGLSLNEDQQPAVRVSWDKAQAFCRWLSENSELEFSLPSESQWEYVCRAGSGTPMNYGTTNDRFSQWGNMADLSLSRGLMEVNGKFYPAGVTQVTGGVPHLLLEGAALSDARSNDRAVVTNRVGSYEPNIWGLYDMHGNAAEWTSSRYHPYPYDTGSTAISGDGSPKSRMVVRGGSFFDPPRRCRSASRLSYPRWQRPFNVGFRVVAR